MQNQSKTNPVQFVSLFEYRGTPNQDGIAKLVHQVAKGMNIPVGKKKVDENPYKEGYVMTYPKEFLDMFFRINLFFKSHYQN
jgi:hypothetical protein